MDKANNGTGKHLVPAEKPICSPTTKPVLEKVNPEAEQDYFQWDAEHIQSLIDALPDGYRAVFVLNAVEGYKHREIAKMLDISESTSKSQLFKARRMLQEQLKLRDVSAQ